MEIHWTKRAEKNLESIENYIASDSPKSAAEVTLKIIHCVEHLGEHPHLGRVGRVHGTRELIIADTPYIIPYRVKENRLEILRVFHSSREWTDF
jgi:toxin ParE1/3/4